MPAGFGLKFSSKKFFFNRPLVSRKLGETRGRALSKVGAFVQRSAKLLLSRRGAKPSKPGTPPRIRVGLLRDHTYFVFDPMTRGVVVGPAKLNMIAMSVGARGGFTKTAGNVPALHEYGGRQGIIETFLSMKQVWVRRDMRYSKYPGERTRLRVANYPARPYMKPALMRNITKFPRFFYRQFR